MRSALLVTCLVPIPMGCQTSAPPSLNDPDVIARCTAESGFTARAAAARAAGATGRISSTPEELAAINACAAGQSTTTLQSVGGMPQSTTRKVTATGTTETYIYGSPPAATPASTPVSTGTTGGRYCNVLTGGAGYGCLKP
ncbi:MAG: hypothetical protein U1E06_14550 [Tabrizicola sp.]|uniref:hypothetical protein n=1 Tax=Tabrizicola sp. TaxID=2005166 RepID=UPI0027332B24|nr:hypothetical protein [Tabrizicola sp.]MDP3261848.1 hypothetical protein [Tabrizicola sp.]MDP3649544.1 hypothetical protein [Paracoccaceae bacterium]MDZ4068044.1 hypothetical protein [Tabrizicola sp.]